MEQNNQKNNQILIYVGVAVVLLAIVGVSIFALQNNNDSEDSLVDSSSSSSMENKDNKGEENSQEETRTTNTENGTDLTSPSPVEDTNNEGTGVWTEYSQEKVAEAGNKDIVLFFNATWCPTCRSTVEDIENNLDNIPSNLTILSTDFDENRDLRQKYGVTVQHTFVKVDENGELIEKAASLGTLEEIVEFAQS